MHAPGTFGSLTPSATSQELSGLCTNCRTGRSPSRTVFITTAPRSAGKRSPAKGHARLWNISFIRTEIRRGSALLEECCLCEFLLRGAAQQVKSAIADAEADYGSRSKCLFNADVLDRRSPS